MNTNTADKDEDGKVKLGPRNFTTKPVKKGKIDSVYFSKPPSYICREDLYHNPVEHQLRHEVKDGHIKAGQDVAFKPAKTVANKYHTASYAHLTDRVEVQKNYKDEDGHVKIGPINFRTNPPKKGRVGLQTTFGGILPHVPDDFENPMKIAREELKYHKSKL